MKTNAILYTFILCIVALSCKDGDKHYFNGEIIEVDTTNIITKNVESHLVSLNGDE
ncbi:MAG: hypothetical protein R3Y04_01680 [Rikenellaceae bacterium]